MNIISPEVFKENHKWASLFPPNYSIDEGIYIDKSEGFNCYAYAMQFTIPVERSQGYYRPGFLCRMAPEGIYTKNTIIPAFLGDCDYLGLNVDETTIEAPLIKYTYKIILWHNECSFNTFHFIRQNDDGKWSEVTAWGECPEVGSRINEDYYCNEGFKKKVYTLSRK